MANRKRLSTATVAMAGAVAAGAVFSISCLEPSSHPPPPEQPSGKNDPGPRSSAAPPPRITAPGEWEREAKLEKFADWDELPWGAVAFSVPEEMAFDASKVIEVVVSPSHAPSELENMIAGEARSLDVKVAPIMTAKLEGSAFVIDKGSPEIQAVAKNTPTRWLWTIAAKPNTYDTQPLALSLWARVNVNGVDADRNIKTLSTQIRVTITPLQLAAGFMGDNWEWFATAFAAVGAWYAKRRWFPERKEAAA